MRRGAERTTTTEAAAEAGSAPPGDAPPRSRMTRGGGTPRAGDAARRGGDERGERRGARRGETRGGRAARRRLRLRLRRGGTRGARLARTFRANVAAARRRERSHGVRGDAEEAAHRPGASLTAAASSPAAAASRGRVEGRGGVERGAETIRFGVADDDPDPCAAGGPGFAGIAAEASAETRFVASWRIMRREGARREAARASCAARARGSRSSVPRKTPPRGDAVRTPDEPRTEGFRAKRDEA